MTIEKDKRTKETVTRRWDGAHLVKVQFFKLKWIRVSDKKNQHLGSAGFYLQVMCSESRQYPDAFSLQVVDESDWRHFNYVAGMVPMINTLMKEVHIMDA